jgi:hypothetical protein
MMPPSSILQYYILLDGFFLVGLGEGNGLFPSLFSIGWGIFMDVDIPPNIRKTINGRYDKDELWVRYRVSLMIIGTSLSPSLFVSTLLGVRIFWEERENSIHFIDPSSP